MVDNVAFRINNNFKSNDQLACDEFNNIFNSNAITVFLLKSDNFVVQLLPSVKRNTFGSANRIHDGMSPAFGANNWSPDFPFRDAYTNTLII